MGQTIVEKILAAHAGREVRPGDIVDVSIDARVARDFGGANVVKNMQAHGLGVADPTKTYFTFDCNPTGSDQKYATNQQICRQYAWQTGVHVYDIDAGIGTHLAIDKGMVGPGGTLVSTDSHANILGSIGAFGQGMGDRDIAHAWAHGKVWFKVPPSTKVILKGRPHPQATAKDITLAILHETGASGFLGYAAELYGDAVAALSMDGRITIASMGTEMGAIIILIPPDETVLEYCSRASRRAVEGVYADPDANYDKIWEIDVDDLGPMVARPGHPDDTVAIAEVAGRPVDSAFIGSCTNGRMDDMSAAAEILKGRKVAPNVVLKIVPSTDDIWDTCMREGIIDTFKEAGALVGNAGCAGCAAGQIGQNGPGEVTVSTGNRNYPGKQGKGEVYLASPATVAASAVAGALTSAESLAGGAISVRMKPRSVPESSVHTKLAPELPEKKPLLLEGRVWRVPIDNIDTDMIFHNRHLAITDIQEMGQHTFGNLPGYENFPEKVRPGDIVVTGSNFGCGSSRQQAVDCFKSLGVSLIVAESFGAIYERNAINAGFPILPGESIELRDGEAVRVDLTKGEVTRISDGAVFRVSPFTEVQKDIYLRGGLL